MAVEIPSAIYEILEAFCQEKLGPDSIEPLTGDASGRRYFRVQMPTGFCPGTLVVMDFRKNLSPSDAALQTEAPVEIPFVNMTGHLAAANIPVPAIYRDESSRGFLLIEDLGDTVFLERVIKANHPTRISWYGAALSLLVSIHRAMWPIPKGCIAGEKSFDYPLLRWELDHYREWGAEVPGKWYLPSTVRRDLDGAFDDLAGEILNMEKGFVHRDFQSKNLMVTDSASPQSAPSLLEPRAGLAVIDYQDALTGPRVYDLVALLNDSYIDLPWNIKGNMIALYAKSRGADVERLTEEFHLVTIHRKLKDGARFIFFDREKGNPSYLPFVDGSFERARQSLKRISGHVSLKKALRAAAPKYFDI